MFKNKTLLITGGTGSFGNAVLDKFINSDLKEIRIFSRDELKQDNLRKKFNNPKIKFYLGDVRDLSSIKDAVKGVNYVFHAAALKQVPSCEFYPMEAVKTNVLGTDNVLTACIEEGVEKVIALSTDKAVYPISVMGASKALMERVAIAKSRNSKQTTIACTRYGNVMATRGSVIPLFIKQIKENIDITVTNPEMTRFMMSLEEAVELVLFAFKNGKNGDIFIQKSPASDIGTIARTLAKLLNKPNHKINIIGTRHGEKLYETLLTKEEMVKAVDIKKYFQIPFDDRDLNYGKFIEDGKRVITEAEEYHSHNAEQLEETELEKLLLSLEDVKKYLQDN